MKGLIIKDFLNLKKQVWPMILFLAVYLVTSVMSKNGSLFTGMAMIFAAMLPITALSYDERAGFTKYALTMPVSRNTLVISKYILALILMSFCALLSLLVNFLIGELSLTENFASTALIMLVGILIVSLSLPSILKFGTEKGRFILIGICALMGGGGAFTVVYIQSRDDFHSLDLISLNPPGTLFILSVIAVGCGVLLISIAISMRVYKNKDF